MKFSRFMLVCALAAGLSSFNVSSALADENLVNEALKAFTQKNYTKANTLIDQHLTNNPNDANAQYAKAMILHRMGHYIKALQRLEIVLKINPKNHLAATSYAAINQQAVYHLNQGKNENAIALAEKSVEIMPKWEQSEFRKALAGCYFAKGTAYFERWCLEGNPEDSRVAMEAWEKTRDLDPTSASQQLVNGINAFINGNYSSAKKLFDDGVAIRDNNKYMQLWQGLANASVGEYSLALKQLNELSSLFVRNPMLHLYKGDIYKITGDYNSAATEYTAALTLRPTDRRINTAINSVYLCSNQVNEGVTFYEQRIAQDPNNFSNYYYLGSLQAEAGRYADALSSFAKAAELPNAKPIQVASARLQMAMLHLEQGDSKSASACITPEDLQVSENASSPLYTLFVAHTDPQLPVCEKAARDVLQYTGADDIFLHRSAFKAWANVEMNRKQYVRAMELLYQVWRRTPFFSQDCALIQEQFNQCRQGALSQISSKLRRATKGKNDDIIEELNTQSKILEGLELGDSGALLHNINTSGVTDKETLIPQELTSNIPMTAVTAVKSTGWMDITPDWQ